METAGFREPPWCLPRNSVLGSTNQVIGIRQVSGILFEFLQERFSRPGDTPHAGRRDVPEEPRTEPPPVSPEPCHCRRGRRTAKHLLTHRQH